MLEVRIRLLGPPLIERGGEAVKTDTRKAVALVSFLAVSGRSASRDQLADLLWPEYGRKRARASLRRTLSSLGAARSEGWLKTDRDDVALNGSEVRLDVDRFHELLSECEAHGHPTSGVCPECLGPLSAAVSLYEDDFMSGFGLRDSAAFDDWQFFQGEELRRELAGALERLSRCYAAGEEWEKAVEHARRWLRLNTLHEPAHRRLISLYAHAGDRAASLRQYRECARVLESELGVAPLDETTALHKSVMENRPPPPPTFSGGVSTETGKESIPALRSPGRLFGRDSEWEALLGAYEAAGGGGRLVVIEGEAGIGKTRLAEELLEYASERGAPTVATRCYPDGANLAYGPFVEALSTVSGRGSPSTLEGLPGHHVSEAARLVPELASSVEGSPPPSLDAPGARSRFFEGVSRTLLAALTNGSPPGILFVDDAHRADASSLELLGYFVRRMRALEQGACVLLTWRAEEAPASHPLRALLAGARRDGAADVVSLGRLGPEAVEEMAAATGAPEGLGRRLYEETEGLPLFLAEYLAAREAGGSEGDWELPGGARDLLQERLAAVGEAERQVLGAAAVIGRSFDFETVREASGRGEDEVLETLEELVSRAMIREVGAPDTEPSYDFTHDKLRGLLYEEIGATRRRILHRRVAEALSALSGRANRRREGAVARIALHYRLAGREEEAAKYFALAGEHARSLHANAEALSHLRTALDLGHPDPARLHEAIGDLHTLRGEYAAALASYEAALAEGPDLACLERKLGNVRGRRGEWERARGHYEAALEGEPSPAEQARLHADLGLLLRSQGKTEEAALFSERALELAGESGDTLALARTHNVAGIISRSSGSLEEARYHLRRSLELSEDPGVRVAALNNLTLAYGDAGETEKAVETALRALDLCIAIGDRHGEAAIRNNLADLFHAAGREGESREHLRRAVGIFAEIGADDEPRPEIWKLVEW